ncbi:class I SAM-dependent methyltransferase [Ensifer sp. SL37]|uniref:class I SAM-dependent methyltransferase n=1 Tax=Ensifer sp. SL37 TaxID=2995137 RepID=UPI00227236CA|nr:class I SAM-dependent methyltransferase [Ensifer sp. SL37]MCY1745072.1 class I SAM-dependent methyltransferase [Ensifer sp. SL37]
MLNRYGKLASWVYDLDKPVGRSFGDQEYYRQRLQHCGDGPILEPAVGNGRLLVPLLEAGFAVEGFDPSTEMLEYCQDECRKRSVITTLTRQTFEAFTYDKRFAAIIIPAGSFQLVTDVTSANAVLRRFYEYLLPNGKLIIDLDPIGSFLGSSGAIRTWTTDGGDLLTLTDHRVETNYVAQTTLSHLRYEHWQGGKLLATELDLFKLRWWGVNEFLLALHAAGFTDVVVSGNYQHGQAPQKDDEIISFEALRPADSADAK